MYDPLSQQFATDMKQHPNEILQLVSHHLQSKTELCKSLNPSTKNFHRLKAQLGLDVYENEKVYVNEYQMIE